MSATGSTYQEQRGGDPAEERRVTSLEQSGHLVFVFAIAQVTGLLTDDTTWMGLLRGSAILAALWWAWVCYSWLTNAVRTEDATAARLVILSAMAAMLVASLAVPGAFGDDGVVFGAAYLAVRLLHVALYAIATGGEPDQQRAVLRLAPWLLAGPVLLVAAGFLNGAPRAALWAGALALDFGGPFVRGVRGLRVHASHFVERYGLVIIIALGESIVAIGLGAAGLELGLGVLLAALLGVAVAAGLWWAYFDHVARRARAEGPGGLRLGRPWRRRAGRAPRGGRRLRPGVVARRGEDRARDPLGYGRRHGPGGFHRGRRRRLERREPDEQPRQRRLPRLGPGSGCQHRAEGDARLARPALDHALIAGAVRVGHER